ncbi:hypothetical protein V2G26_016467 [Clonostachys chloroleuca]|uniref:NmrA-like domain-containing protein n=1 Tax=Clonostachys chloroleuca TaxID=1926264 RepID=A0AA35MH82_9HYPO|nr:unnamed protein product [Clonostachys chloroleuca]
MKPQAVFVCGATGTQGGALARQLLSKGIAVHAVARNLASPKAKAIESQGAKLWHGDFDNESALRDALAGTAAVFLNFMPDFNDASANLRQAKLIIRLAQAAGVTHAVCSSGMKPDRLKELLVDVPEDTFFSQIMRVKLDIEKEVSLGFQTSTILRPGFFMANFMQPLVMMYPDLTSTGKWTTALLADTRLTLTDTETIGVFAAAAVLDPERFNGKDIHFCDELLTTEEIAQKLKAATGKDIERRTLPEEDVQAQKEANPFIRGQLAMRTMARDVSMEEIKGFNLPLSTFDAFLTREKETLDITFANVPKA